MNRTYTLREILDEIDNRFDDLGMPESTLLGRLNLLESSYDAEIENLNNIAKKYEQEADTLKAEMGHMQRRYHDLHVMVLNSEKDPDGNKQITIVKWMEQEIKKYAGLESDNQ